METHNEKKEISYYYLPTQYIEELYKLAYNVSTILKNNNITYWIEGGTLLGAVRDKKHIMYDDDIDFGILINEYSKLVSIKDEFIKLGYKVEKVAGIFKIYIDFPWIKYRNRIIPPPTLDIFIYRNVKKKGKNIIILDEIELRKMYINSYYIHSDLFPLKTYNYGDVLLNGCNNPIRYLNSLYPDWDKKYVIDIREPSENNSFMFKENISKIVYEKEMIGGL